MRVLNVLQPWASLIFAKDNQGNRIKVHETRSWRTNYEGPVAILASAKRGTPDGPLASLMTRKGIDNPEDYPLGVIIGTAYIQGPDAMVPTDNHPTRHRLHPTDFVTGDWTPGRWAWRLTGARRLKRPIPTKGKLGLWHPDQELLTAIQQARTEPL